MDSSEESKSKNMTPDVWVRQGKQCHQAYLVSKDIEKNKAVIVWADQKTYKGKFEVYLNDIEEISLTGKGRRSRQKCTTYFSKTSKEAEQKAKAKNKNVHVKEAAPKKKKRKKSGTGSHPQKSVSWSPDLRTKNSQDQPFHPNNFSKKHNKNIKDQGTAEPLIVSKLNSCSERSSLDVDNIGRGDKKYVSDNNLERTQMSNKLEGKRKSSWVANTVHASNNSGTGWGGSGKNNKNTSDTTNECGWGFSDFDESNTRNNCNDSPSQYNDNGSWGETTKERNFEVQNNWNTDGSSSLNDSSNNKSAQKKKKKKRSNGLGPPATPIAVMRFLEDHMSFLRWKWGDRMLIMEQKLNDSTLEKKMIKDGKEYELVARKDFEQGGFYKYKQIYVKAYYIASRGPGITPLDLKEEFESIADFSCIEPRKCVSRMELLVSPAIKDGKTHLHFELSSDLFEIVDENYNMGCGFVPKKVLMDDLEFGEEVSAIQVRIISPSLGVFKGMLMAKQGIKRVQLPTSMMKVKPSLNAEGDSVYILIKASFPAKTNIDLEKHYDPELTLTQAGQRRLRKMTRLDASADTIKVLESVVPKVLESYINSDCLEHANLVGVADPTDALPRGTVFVTGMDFAGCITDVLVTRRPCTGPNDVVKLPHVVKRPKKMSPGNWNFLKKLPIGIIVFAAPIEGEPGIPETIAGGDLDGDKYLIIWNEEVVKDYRLPPCGMTKNDDDSYESDDSIVGCQSSDFVVLEKLESNEYLVKLTGRDSKTRKMTREEILDGRAYVDCVLSHEGNVSNITLNIRFTNGKTERHRLNEQTKREMGNVVAKYAFEKGLENERGWMWVNKKFAYIKKLDEKEGSDSDDSTVKERDWFEKLQDELSSPRRLYETKRLTTTLHSAYKIQREERGVTAPEVIALGNAYKQSLEILKHGGKLYLPSHLWNFLSIIPKIKQEYIEG